MKGEIVTMNRLMGSLLVLAMLLGAADALAKKDKMPDVRLVPAAAGEQLFLILDDPLYFDYTGGLFGNLVGAATTLYVKPGRHEVKLTLVGGNRRWLLLPFWEHSKQGTKSSITSEPSAFLGNQCDDDVYQYVAIDEATMEIAPRIWRRFIHNCRDTGPAKPKDSWSSRVKVARMGQLVLETQADRDARQRAADAARRADDAVRLFQAQARMQQNDLDLPKKQEMGARLCRDEGPWRFIAYTEAVSPDNGKLKLRVSKAVSVSNPNRVSPDYREEIVWDAPIRWTLCN